MGELSPETHVVLDLFLETIVYGFSAFMFPVCLWFLCRGKKLRQVNPIGMILSCLLFSLSTTHMGIKLHRVIYWFSQHEGVGFDSLSPDTRALGLIYPIQTLLGDAVVIYRCYVVWQSVSVILLPVAMWLVLQATWLSMIAGTMRHDTAYVFTRQGAMLLNTFYAFTILTNFISTGLLAYRIWKIDHEATKGRRRVIGSRVLPIMTISLDAGLLYTAMLLATIIVFARKSESVFIFMDVLVPTIALTFYMVIIRIGLATSAPSTVLSATEPPSKARTAVSNASSMRQHMPSISVHVSTSRATVTQQSSSSHGDESSIMV